MIEKKLCENNHKIYIGWETGTVYEKPCVNIATKYTVDSFGIFYMCDECYADDCKRRIDSDRLTLED
jgi:hypothetical protein